MTDTDIVVGSATLTAPKAATLSEKRTILFTIRGVADLPDEINLTPPVLCHGFHWFLEIFPNGDKRAKLKKGGPFFSVFLRCQEGNEKKPETILANATFRIGQIVGALITADYHGRGWGPDAVWKRDQILNECDEDRSLVLKVDLRVDVNLLQIWKPKANLKGNLTKLFSSQKGTDVSFAVGGKSIRAHKCILAIQESNLTEFIDGSTCGTEVVIDDDPDLFEAMVLYHYTEEIPSHVIEKGKAVDLLKLADKYGVVKLKMLLEAMIAESPTLLSTYSCLELLLLAESHNCALLREASMSVVLDQMPQVMHFKEWADVLQSPGLVKEIFQCQAHRAKGSVNNDRVGPVDKVSVNVLRERLSDLGLDVDGSREVLVKRLKMATEQEPATNKRLEK